METKSIEEIRNTLSSYTIPKNQIEQKGNGNFKAKYLKWSYALGIFLNHYPEARWEFTQWEQADGTMVDVQYYKDGSCSVECRVFVGNVSQYMWLPVTKSTGNQSSGNSFDINTAKMRCLTKCIAVCFGLGADIYGMDMLQETVLSNKEGGKEVSSNESPIPKSTSIKKPPSAFVEEPDAPHRLKGVDKIMVGGGKGTTYNDAYRKCTDIEKVRKDIKKWRGKKLLSIDQQTHLNTLIAMEKHINAMTEKRMAK